MPYHTLYCNAILHNVLSYMFRLERAIFRQTRNSEYRYVNRVILKTVYKLTVRIYRVIQE
jgi:hypothetical protein